MRHLVLTALLMSVCGAGAAVSQERAVPQSQAQVQLSYAPIVARAAPAVVNVYSNRIVRQAVNPFFQQFFGEGGDSIRVGLGWVWLTNIRAGNVWRIDPKRILATLAE